MSDGVSVIICCHNSAQRLPETLRHLAAQRVPANIPWEIVVIDNASTDDTAQTALSLWPASHPASLRVVAESEPGLSHARIRGIREARYQVISFVDDDNWLSPTWIKRVHGIFAEHAEVGACGGRIEAVCEVPPPAWFQSVQGQYAVGQHYDATGDITNTAGTLLCGAGLSLRTAAVRILLEQGFVFMMSGRKGGRLTAGEDTELCFALRASGWKFWYDSELLLRHFIPETRLQWSYALALKRGIGGSSALFDLYLFALNGPPFSGYPGWKKKWSFQLLKALGRFIQIALAHPLACLFKPKGSRWVLELESMKCRLSALMELRSRYQEVQEEIRQAAWRRQRSTRGE
jgi:glycosyltransferase involved in cell wall biosynthesis